MKMNFLYLNPSQADEKRWVAEITGEDPTYKLKRSFQPEHQPGVWAMYDGWYQIHGQVVGITPFQKEYVRIQNGKMTRRLPFRQVMADLPAIIAFEPQRIERLRHQINLELNDIIQQAPFDRVLIEMEQQKDEVSMVDSSDELLGGLTVLKKRKPMMIHHYKELYEDIELDF